MCIISDKLKLCSCKNKDVSKLKNYWILGRPDLNLPVMLGEIHPPSMLSISVKEINEEKLENLLNAGKCFDIDLQHRDEDELYLFFTVENKKGEPRLSYGESGLSYAFKHQDGKWQSIPFDVFAQTEDVQQGSIKHAFDQRQ